MVGKDIIDRQQRARARMPFYPHDVAQDILRPVHTVDKGEIDASAQRRLGAAVEEVVAGLRKDYGPHR